MTDNEKPRAPRHLRARGRRFWDSVLRDFEVAEGPESALLGEACRTLDEIEDLKAALTRDGVTVAGSMGQTRVHPALETLRSHRLSVVRILAQLGLPAPEDDVSPRRRRK